MKITILSRYSRLGASSRVRSLQYVPYLQQAGFDIEVCPFFDDAYLTDLYAGRRHLLRMFPYFLKRLSHCRAARGADLIWIEKEALPWVPWVLECAILPSKVPYVVDYDDSVFHRYDLHGNSVIRWLLGKKIDRVMAGSACVTVGNEYLASRASEAGSSRIEYLPTVVDMERYFVPETQESRMTPLIGWIGTPKTWKSSAEPTFDVLLPVLEAENAKFLAVGASLKRGVIGRLEMQPWLEGDEVKSIQSFDIGVMPLQNDPWTLGKCGYKLIQYMACGVPVVASPVGVNNQIVQHGVNGYLAETDDEWRHAISTLIARPDLRRQMGAAGRRWVEEHYSLQTWRSKITDILQSTVSLTP